MSLLSPQLEAFIAIAEHKTVHGAAKAVHITQTAATQRIRALEARLRTTLFVRTRRGMLLTPEGEALLRYCHAAKDLEGQTLAKIQGAATHSEIRMGITGSCSIMRSRVIPQCSAVIKKFPQLLLTFNINDLENREQDLKAGRYQFAILQPEQIAREMESKALKPEKYVLVCATQWKKRRLQDIIQSERIIDFDPTDQMTFNYLKHYHLFNKARLDRHYVNNTEDIAYMLMAGLGYCVLTTEFCKPYVDNHQLMILNSGKVYEHKLSLAWYDRPEPPKYFTAIMNAIS